MISPNRTVQVCPLCGTDIGPAEEVGVWEAARADDPEPRLIHRRCQALRDRAMSWLPRAPADETRITAWIRAQLAARFGEDFGFAGRLQVIPRVYPHSPNWDCGNVAHSRRILAPRGTEQVMGMIREAQERFDLEPASDEGRHWFGAR